MAMEETDLRGFYFERGLYGWGWLHVSLDFRVVCVEYKRREELEECGVLGLPAFWEVFRVF